MSDLKITAIDTANASHKEQAKIQAAADVGQEMKKGPDAECDIDYVPNKARTGQGIRILMSNFLAFGGTNAVLLVRKV